MTHPHLKFVIGRHKFRTFDKAALFAIDQARATSRTIYLDVIVTSEEGAAAYGGDWAVGEYLDNPDAIIFERWAVNLENMGRIP